MLTDAGPIRPPWVEHPYRLISWWDMEKFSAEKFCAITHALCILEHGTEEQEAEQKLSLSERRYLKRILRPKMVDACASIGLGLTVEHINHLCGCLVSGVTFREIRELIPALNREVIYEMKKELFLHVPAKDALYYSQLKPLFGETVAERFPSSNYDIEEAGKCFATGRYTAAVLHAMRVLEPGLASLSKALKVRFNESGWEGLLNRLAAKWRRIEARKSKPRNWKKDRQFYSEAFVEFRYFKDAWRNYSVHAHATYDEERAKVILLHAESFMRHLATKLKE